MISDKNLFFIMIFLILTRYFYIPENFNIKDEVIYTDIDSLFNISYNYERVIGLSVHQSYENSEIFDYYNKLKYYIKDKNIGLYIVKYKELILNVQKYIYDQKPILFSVVKGKIEEMYSLTNIHYFGFYFEHLTNSLNKNELTFYPYHVFASKDNYKFIKKCLNNSRYIFPMINIYKIDKETVKNYKLSKNKVVLYRTDNEFIKRINVRKISKYVLNNSLYYDFNDESEDKTNDIVLFYISNNISTVKRRFLYKFAKIVKKEVPNIKIVYDSNHYRLSDDEVYKSDYFVLEHNKKVEFVKPFDDNTLYNTSLLTNKSNLKLLSRKIIYTLKKLKTLNTTDPITRGDYYILNSSSYHVFINDLSQYSVVFYSNTQNKHNNKYFHMFKTLANNLKNKYNIKFGYIDINNICFLDDIPPILNSVSIYLFKHGKTTLFPLFYTQNLELFTKILLILIESQTDDMKNVYISDEEMLKINKLCSYLGYINPNKNIVNNTCNALQTFRKPIGLNL